MALNHCFSLSHALCNRKVCDRESMLCFEGVLNTERSRELLTHVFVLIG